MKKRFKIILIGMIILIIVFVIFSTINLALNKKYVVDEISYTTRKEGLVGIQELITDDYINMIYFNVFYIFILVGVAILILFLKRKQLSEHKS